MADSDLDMPASKTLTLRDEMIKRLADTDAHFKHQQRGEPDLTHEEKAKIAQEILQKNPAKFLEQFSKFLTPSDIDCFKDFRGDYMVDYYITDITQRGSQKDKNVIKNRRYRAMQNLMDQGEYFSENEMKRRDPLLFEQMVGQYETEEEMAAKAERDIDKSDLRFSNILLKHMDIQADKQLYERMKEREEEQEEEEEESDDDDEDEEIEDETTAEKKGWNENRTGETSASPSDETEEMSEIERNQLKNEFLKIMQERFMAGNDADVDYKSIDTNQDYDSLDILNNDAEESYFDSEVPHIHRRGRPHRMLTDSASDSSLSDLGGGDSDLMGSHIRHRIRTLELQEDSGDKMSDKMDDDNGEDSDDYMKFDVSSGVKEGEQAVT